MNIASIRDSYKKIDNLLSQKKVKESLDLLHILAKETQNSHLIDEVYTIEQSYRNMIKFIVDGYSDPMKAQSYLQITHTVLLLADETVSILLADKLNGVGKNQKEDFLEEIQNIETGLSEYKIEDNNPFIAIMREELLGSLFKIIAFGRHHSQTEIAKLDTLFFSDNITTNEKLTLTSAYLLSLSSYFDERKIHTLLKLSECQNAKLAARSLVVVALILIKYNNRLQFYPTIINHLDTIRKSEIGKMELKNIITQLLNTNETEKVARKFTNEILPEMFKLNPNIKRKLDLDNLLKDNSLSDDKTPDWEELINENPKLMDKIDQINKMQKEGLDLLSSTFIHLKGFAYFNEIQHWFQPFYADNSFVSHTLELPGNDHLLEFPKFMELLPTMCDSDKYSMFFAIIEMPLIQKDMIRQLTKNELIDNAHAINEEFMNNSTKATKNFSNLYIQDIYRFYNAYSRSGQFPNLLKMEVPIQETILFKHLFSDTDALKDLGLYHFKNENWNEALKAFINFNNTFEPQPDVLQKIGYCYQQLNNYTNALEFYLKADFFDLNKHWIYKKIALCYGTLNQPLKALEYYLMAEEIDPQNLHTQASIGQCHLQLQDYEEALKYYFKVEFLDPSNQNVWKPIAWCCFILGKFETSEKYYLKLIQKEKNFYDLVSYGTLLWAKGEKNAALQQYIKSIKLSNCTIATFLESFEEEVDYLRKLKIDDIEIAAFIDELKYNIAL